MRLLETQMRIERILLPALTYLGLATFHLVTSAAPMRVHALTLAVLALALPVPALIASGLRSRAQRVSTCIVFGAAAMVVWDGCAYLVIAKPEPFSILRSAPLAYVFGIGSSAVMSWLIAFFASLATRRKVALVWLGSGKQSAKCFESR